MSWDQNYNVPHIENLLEWLIGESTLDILKKELYNCQGAYIVKEEQITLDDGFYQTVTGYKITLSDGRVFVPKLVKSETANGNWGRDTYEYMLESETPKVEYISHDDVLDSDPDNCCGNLNDCGC